MTPGGTTNRTSPGQASSSLSSHNSTDPFRNGSSGRSCLTFRCSNLTRKRTGRPLSRMHGDKMLDLMTFVYLCMLNNALLQLSQMTSVLAV